MSVQINDEMLILYVIICINILNIILYFILNNNTIDLVLMSRLSIYL